MSHFFTYCQADFKTIMEELEELEDIKLYDKAKKGSLITVI